MVGRRAAVVLAEAYLSGSVLALERLILRACFRSPVGVCKHAIAVHVERRRHKHVVDAAVRLQVGVERVERSVLCEAQTAALIRVLKDSRLGEDGVYLVILVYIEVARKNNGSTLGYLLYLPHDKLRALAACRHAHVVHVKIEVIELELRVLLPELAPRAYAYACGVPSELWRVGRLVEPEIALAQELYAVFLVEDG